MSVGLLSRALCRSAFGFLCLPARLCIRRPKVGPPTDPLHVAPLNLASINWEQVACDPVLTQPIPNGHAARMRFFRFRKSIDKQCAQSRSSASGSSHLVTSSGGSEHATAAVLKREPAVQLSPRFQCPPTPAVSNASPNLNNIANGFNSPFMESCADLAAAPTASNAWPDFNAMPSLSDFPCWEPRNFPLIKSPADATAQAFKPDCYDGPSSFERRYMEAEGDQSLFNMLETIVDENRQHIKVELDQTQPAAEGGQQVRNGKVLAPFDSQSRRTSSEEENFMEDPSIHPLPPKT
ncbi:hypothetical protein XA68_11545 [Ophiocordyceps unilateralis]|uniref:Uncharacterized protein n=1 Tax=Ophiocordyceps unilateralis TaxID=268505 RepID=A0A2A9PFM2_OPHUN|nr:hypothetical protein XA68_11545 [Ophiocordyceps unilateralis]